MSKSINTAGLDAVLAYIADSTQIDITSDSTTPTNLSNSLVAHAMTAGDGNGDYTIATGDVSGRKVTVTQQTGLTVSVSGTARHIVLSSAGSPRVIRLVTTCTDQALTSGNSVTIPAFKYEATAPT